MKMTSSQFKLKDLLKDESSRSSAIEVREFLFALLKQYDCITLDLQNVNFTPSVADEIVGGLAIALGAEAFKNRIKLLNATESQIVLMKHVIARRIANRAQK